MWEAWRQVEEKFEEWKYGPTEHVTRILYCAIRLSGGPCSEIGMCWTAPIFRDALPKAEKRGSSFVAPVPSNSSSTGSPQDRQATIPEAASDNGRIPGAGAIYDVTTSNHRAVSIG